MSRTKITAGFLNTGAVSANSNIGENVVTEHNIKNGNITTEKLGAGSVTTAKVASGITLSPAKVTATGPITTPKVTANTLASTTLTATNANFTTLQADAIDFDGDVTVDKVTANTILATSADFTTLQADSIDFDGDLTVDGITANTIVANGGVTVDNITIDGTEIDLSSGDLTVDVAGDIVLDADGADIILKDAGTEFGRFTNSSTDFVIKSATSDKDTIFKGNDGGSEITALTLDMSEGGAATFNAGATISSSSSGEFNALTISQANNTSGNESRIRFKRTTDAGSDREVAAIVADRVGGNDTDLVFETNTDGSDGATEKMRLSHLGILSADQVFGLTDTDNGIALAANGTDIIQIYTANNERLRIAADGKVGINTTAANLQLSVNFSSASAAGLGIHDTNSGNLGGMLQFYSGSGQGTLRANIMNANNGGVHFAMGDGSIIFGSTSYDASHALDDYEEGTWTPVCGTAGVTGTYSGSGVQLGRFIKVGHLVHVIFNLSISAAYTGSTSSSFTIGGLPFATKYYDGSLYAGGHIGYYFNLNHTDNNNTIVYQIPSGSSFTMELKGVGDNIGEQIVTPAMMGSGAVIRGSITYHAA